MNFHKRIIALFMSIVIVFATCLMPVYAAWQNDLGYWYVNSSFAQWAVGSVLNAAAVAGGTAIGGVAGTVIVPGAGAGAGAAVGGALGGYVAQLLANGIYGLADYYAAGYTDDSYLDYEAEYIESLGSDDSESSDATGSGGSDGAGAGRFTSSSDDIAYDYVWEGETQTYTIDDNFDLFTDMYSGFSVYNFFAQYPNGGFVFGCDNNWRDWFISRTDETTGLRYCLYNMSYGLGSYSDTNVPLFTNLYEELGTSIPFASVTPKYSNRFFFSYDDASIYWESVSPSSKTYFLTPLTRVCAKMSVWENEYGVQSRCYPALDGLGCINPDGTIELGLQVAFSINGLWMNEFYYGDAVPTDETALRAAYLAKLLVAYNASNNYEDNSTVGNYFIGDVGEDGSVTDVYSPAVYDEETLVFTEPVTGAQYQTTGWTYDYTTRSYDITLDAGTYTIDGTDVTRIVSTYGDDLVTITYYDASGTALATDEYAYVMASQSECGLYGHTYTYENVSVPTCIEPGERKYTCSVCGHERVEEVAVLSHTYNFFVLSSPACTAAGIGLYTCSMCGNQYTEPIPPTGHTDKLIEYVPTEYDENGTAITVGYSIYECEVCGTQYTVSDEIPIEEESWFSWLFGLFKGLISSIVNGCSAAIEWFLGDVLGTVIDWFAQLAQWLFGQFDGSALAEWFNWFSDDNKILADEFGQDSSSSEVDVWAYSFD